MGNPALLGLKRLSALCLCQMRRLFATPFVRYAGWDPVAGGCSIGLGTAHDYLQRAEAAKIMSPLEPDWDDDRLEAALFGPRSVIWRGGRQPP